MTDPHSETGGEPVRMPPLARLVGRRPNRGATDVAKEVVSDVQQLLRAEIALAKAEVTDGIKSKAMGAGFFIGVAVIGWLFIQAFLVFLGFVFGTFLPAWAAAGLVVLLLLIAMGVLGFLGYRKLQAEVSLTTSSSSREESQRVAQAAVDRAKGNAEQGISDAKETVAETIADVKQRLHERRGKPGLGTGEDTAQAPAPPTARAVQPSTGDADTASRPAPANGLTFPPPPRAAGSPAQTAPPAADGARQDRTE